MEAKTQSWGGRQHIKCPADVVAVVVADHFYIARFSALEQTDCAACDLAFHSASLTGLPPKWCTYSAGIAGAT